MARAVGPQLPGRVGCWLAVLMALRATSQFSPGPIPAAVSTAVLNWVAFHEAVIAKATWRHES